MHDKIDELDKKITHEMFKQFRTLGQYLLTVTDVQELKDTSKKLNDPMVLEITKSEIKELGSFILEFEGFVSKWYDKKLPSLKHFMILLADAMDSFMAGPSCTKQLASETTNSLFKIVTEKFGETIKRKLDELKNNEIVDANVNFQEGLTTLTDENGKRLSIEDLEKIFDEKEKSTIQ
jgi:GTPase SAR1 family protein